MNFRSTPIPKSPVVFGTEKNPFLQFEGKKFNPVQENDITSFSFISDGHLIAKELIQNGNFIYGKNDWQEGLLAGAGWNISPVNDAYTNLNSTNPNSKDFFQAIDLSGINSLMLEFDIDKGLQDTFLEVYGTDAYGARIGLVFSTNQVGHHQVLLDNSGFEGILFSAHNNNLTSITSDFLSLDNVSLKKADNIFSVSIKDENKVLKAYLGKDFLIQFIHGHIYTFVSFQWNNLNLAEGLYFIHLDFEPIGFDLIGDKLLISPTGSPYWQETTNGGTIMRQQFNSGFIQGMKFTSNGSGLALSIKQENVLSRGMKYTFKVSISDKTSNIAPFGISFYAGGNRSPIFEIGNGDAIIEMFCGFNDSDFGIFISSSFIHNGESLHLSNLEISPLENEESFSKNSYYFRKSWPFTSLIKYRNRKEIQGHIFPNDFYYFQRLEADIIHPEIESEVEVLSSASGKHTILRKNIQEIGYLAISPVPENMIESLELLYYCNEIYITTPGSIEEEKIQIVSNDFKPFYKQGGSEAGLDIKIIRG